MIHIVILLVVFSIAGLFNWIIEKGKKRGF